MPYAFFDGLINSNAMSTYTPPSDRDANQEYFVTYGGSDKDKDDVILYSDITPEFSAIGRLSATNADGVSYTRCVYLVDPTNCALRVIFYYQ
jgi:hypothetical protein